MGLLARLGNYVARGEIEVRAVVLPVVLPEHRQKAAHCVFPNGALVAKAALKWVKLRRGCGFTDAQLHAPVAEQIQG